MSLLDLKVYSEYAYETATEVLDQQVALFNEASAGTITLRPAAHQGDFSDTAFFQKIPGGTVRRRNAYGSGAIAQQTLKHIIDRSVKVGAGTFEFTFEPQQFLYIQQNPEIAGIAFGQQLAKDMLADMLNTGIGATVAAMSGVPELVNDVTAATAPADQKATPVNLARTVGKLGDRQSAVVAWIMHSGPLTDLYVNALQNAERLFNYGTVNVVQDGFGRRYIISDSPSLQWSSGANEGFWSMGLQPAAIYVGQNNDFNYASEERTGRENIVRTYQAEWTYNVGVAGFAWDIANGGKAPTDAALFSGANWDRYATSHKDMGGVLLKSK